MFNVRVYFFEVFGDVDIQNVVNVVSVGLLQHVFHLLVQLEVPLPSMAITVVLPGIPTTLLSSAEAFNICSDPREIPSGCNLFLGNVFIH